MNEQSKAKGKVLRGTMATAIALSLGLVPLSGCVGTQKTEEKPAASQTQKSTSNKSTSNKSTSGKTTSKKSTDAATNKTTTN